MHVHQIVKNTIRVRLGSFFKVSGGYAYGAAVSIGLKYKVDPASSTFSGAGLFTAGYIHTHPSLVLFSGDDLNYAIDMYKKVNVGWYAGGMDQSAFVVNRAGGVYRWDVSDWWSSGGNAFKNPLYYHRVGQ